MAEWLRWLASNELHNTTVGSDHTVDVDFLHVRKLFSSLAEGRWFYQGSHCARTISRRCIRDLPTPLTAGDSSYDLS